MLVSTGACQSQTKKEMTKNNNPLLCDPIEGICGIPDSNATQNTLKTNSQQSVTIVYFTDPICSSCWGIEPQLRKLKLEYGNNLHIDYHMGGLLPDWTYNSGGISKPSDVAQHWDEVSKYYDMPIDGDVWLEDPLPSSYPPSIAFKAAQLQDEEKALFFLREIREMVFLRKKNITKWENLEQAAKTVGLNPERLKTDMAGQGKTLFEADLKLARDYAVRGFPTLFFQNKNAQQETVYGAKPYAAFENALVKLEPSAKKAEYPKTWEALFATYPSLTAREFSELSGTARSKSEELLNELVSTGQLEKHNTKNGPIWIRKKKS